MLNVSTETVHFVNAHDLDNFVNATYGVDYSFTADQECGNDSSHTFEVEDEISDYLEGNVTKFLNDGQYFYFAGTLLNKMAVDGHIKPGKYVINVSW